MPLPLSSPQALSILMLPHNIPSGLSLLTSMVDDMWHYAGDQSTDVSAFGEPTGYRERLGLSLCDFFDHSSLQGDCSAIPILGRRD